MPRRNTPKQRRGMPKWVTHPKRLRCACRKPRKVAFYDEVDAKLALAEIQSKDSQYRAYQEKGMEKTIYRCHLGNWHLSSWVNRWDIDGRYSHG